MRETVRNRQRETEKEKTQVTHVPDPETKEPNRS